MGGSVVAGLLMRSGGVQFPVSGLRWYVLGEFRVVAWCERHNCFTCGWDDAECWFGAEGCSLWM